MSTWKRRFISIPLMLVLWSLWAQLLPVTLLLSLGVDLVRRRRWATTRTLLFFGAFLLCENLGILACGAIWLLPGSPERFQERNYALQRWWNNTLFNAGQWLYGMKVELSWEHPAEEVGTRPVLLLPRHVSTADTVLPVGIFSARHGIRLRFVLKEELLWDPCLDIVGNRVPNCFVRRARTRRGGGEGVAKEVLQAESRAELERVRNLGAHLKAGEGVLIYPEGTRFTASKRRELIAKGGDLGERAQRFERVLPPVPGGTLAVLDAALPRLDIWFCGHTGYEGAGSFKELINGDLIGKTVRIHFWRVRGEEVPQDRLAWLEEQWQKMDRWVAVQKDA